MDSALPLPRLTFLGIIQPTFSSRNVTMASHVTTATEERALRRLGSKAFQDRCHPPPPPADTPEPFEVILEKNDKCHFASSGHDLVSDKNRMQSVTFRQPRDPPGPDVFLAGLPSESDRHLAETLPVVLQFEL